MNRIAPSHLVLLFLLTLVFLWSGWDPYDRLTWWLEVAPGIAGIIVLAFTYNRFRFTTLVYTLIAIHIAILCVGGHYTYAKVPLFDWLKPIFHWQRNHYDRLGHFAQGFVPAMIAREVFIGLRIVERRGWLFFIVLCVCMGISAFYELVEWWTALVGGGASVAFLGTQGDIWDTQEDMFMALIGATCALILLRAPHDRQIKDAQMTKLE